jgi:hypothetical protein
MFRHVNADDRARGTLRPGRGRDGTADSGTQSRGRSAYALRFHGRELPLFKSLLVIGRSSESCDLVIDGPQISRRHARLVVNESSVVIEDLGSRNGVFVNSIQVKRPTLLRPGDSIMIGDEMLELVERTARSRRQVRQAGAAHTEPRSPRSGSVPSRQHGQEDEAPTNHTDAFALLRSVVDPVLEAGHADEAERLLSGHLHILIRQARAGLRPLAAQAQVAAEYAAQLASITAKSSWVSYPIELYLVLGEPMPLPIVDALYSIIRHVQVDRSLLRRYVAMLRGRAERFGPAERFALQRIEGLERLAAL